MKKRTTAKFRVALGQVGLLVSLLLIALLLGLVPDRKGAVREGRAALAESVAIHVTRQVVRTETDQMEADLQLIVARNSDLLSAAIRRGASDYVVVVGDHEKYWQSMTDELSFDSQVLVPIYSGKKKWGQLELRFASTTGVPGFEFSQAQIIPLVLFLSVGSFIIFYLYLGKMLKHLDPSKAIPQRVRSALDTMAEGLLVIDKRGQIVLANSAIAGILGKDVDEMLGWKADDLCRDVGDNEPNNRSVRPWTACLKNSQPQRNAIVHLRDHQNEVRTFIVNCSPVMAKRGKTGGALISFDDVTQLERKKIELGLAMEAAEAANKSKSQFLANMSHEIRTPMNAILGFTDVLRRGYRSGIENPMQHLDTIHSNGTHLLDLINDILDLSKVESGHLEIEHIACSPCLIVREVLNALIVKANDKGITLGMEIDKQIPSVITSDPSRLRQIITNLAGNAIKFTNAGGVRVVLGLTSEAEPRLRIDVCDSGIGMTHEEMGRIFDPFSQADSSVTRRFGGTGLGLTISRRYAEALGGTIEVSSKPGKGSVFSVTISTGSLEGISMLQAEQLDSIADQKVSLKGSWRFRHQRVLVVDDARENRDLMSIILREVGLQVECAENGELGVEKALGDSFDVILMDMQMPVMDGHAATRLLRQQGLGTPIYALTAHAMKGFEKECMASGCTGYLTKPIDIDLLLDTLARVLGAERTNPKPSGQFNPKVVRKPVASELPLVSKHLPKDHPDVPELLRLFESRLDEELELLNQAMVSRDFQLLQDRAARIREMGEAIGMDEITDSSMRLQTYAECNDLQQIGETIAELESLTNRIRIPGDQPVSSWIPISEKGEASENPNSLRPLYSQLPMEYPEFRAIVQEFVPRLESKLDEMESASGRRDFKKIAELAHWLKGSGGTVGFPQFTEPSAMLEQLAKANGNINEINKLLNDLRCLANRIEVAEGDFRNPMNASSDPVQACNNA